MTNFSGEPLSLKTGNAACGGPQGGGLDSRRNGVAEVSSTYLVDVPKTVVPMGYKQTELGVIPEDWECIPSKEIVSYLGGFAFSSKAATTDGIRWLKIANVGLNEVKWDAESYLPASYSQVHQEYLLRESDVVMALTRPILCESLKVAILNETDAPALLNQRVAKLVPKNAGDQRFLYYLVQTSNFIAAMNLAMAGSDPPNIGTRALGDISVLVPKLPKEQTAIANALSDVDALISEMEKLIAKKQAILTATMQQLLTGRTRLPQFALRDDGVPKGTKPSELGEIPEDWEVVQLGDCSAYIGSGKTNTKSTGDFPLYGSTGLIGSCTRAEYSGEALLVARVGANAGRLNFVSGEYGVSDNTIIIKLKSKNNIGFFKYWLIRKNLNTLVFGSGQPLITGTQLKDLALPLPSIKEQTAIATILSDMDEEIQALEQCLGKNRQIKQGMMQELLTGKTRLVRVQEP